MKEAALDCAGPDGGCGARTGLRPGGRSARVQEAVHRAVRDLQQGGGEELTVPQIAARAGVTPSTIYRRWGTLAQLLSDVAVQTLRPDSGPVDTGSLQGDLTRWLEQYLDEMTSAPGRAMLRDVIGGTGQGNPGQCVAYLRQQLEMIRIRAEARGEQAPAAEAVLDRVVAPMLFRILFTDQVPDFGYFRDLLNPLLGAPEGTPQPG